jgi:hypothetical protein
MAELANPYTCDICNVFKGETNHWWRVWRTDDGLVLIAPWEFQAVAKHQHVCGVECALRLAAKLMDPA